MRTAAALALLLAAVASAAATLLAAPPDLALTGYVVGWTVFALVGVIVAVRRETVRPAKASVWLRGAR